MSVLFRHKTVGSLKVFTFVPKDLYIRGKRRDRRLLISIVRIVRVPPFPFMSRILFFLFLVLCLSDPSKFSPIFSLSLDWSSSNTTLHFRVLFAWSFGRYRKSLKMVKWGGEGTAG